MVGPNCGDGLNLGSKDLAHPARPKTRRRAAAESRQALEDSRQSGTTGGLRAAVVAARTDVVLASTAVGLSGSGRARATHQQTARDDAGQRCVAHWRPIHDFLTTPKMSMFASVAEARELLRRFFDRSDVGRAGTSAEI